MTKKLGQDYADFLKEAKEIPEVREYLNSFSVIIGDLVMARRIQLGWSQKELAEAAGTTQPRISQIEAAYDGVKMGTINKVFRALGLAQINPGYREDAAGTELALKY
ncbi:hypothetical protein BC351_05865 [Paenibacillus ferrarius]|uniref:HTH cro/C1-type domain-containing protein n=1 Tax=Paenibacillus ferrarius TaxID=1469647 RepID=A0A1V4HG51_9BACL|nr:helix-turn-helix domain-containing protein [Paenibacillus ferrarius]OPH53389.1 hypothetical protein BC351_05865 [Paenibacillus ferrarius]